MPSGYFKLKDGTIVPLDLTGSGSPDRLFMGESRMSPDTWQRTPDLLPSSGGVDAEMNMDFQRAKEVADYTLKSGGTAEDADKIGTQPVLMKYKILAASPELKDDPNKLEEFNSEYGEALQRFYQGIADGDKPEESSGKYLLPVQNKWISSSTLLKSERVNAREEELRLDREERRKRLGKEKPKTPALLKSERDFFQTLLDNHPEYNDEDKAQLQGKIDALDDVGFSLSEPKDYDRSNPKFLGLPAVPKIKILSIKKVE